MIAPLLLGLMIMVVVIATIYGYDFGSVKGRKAIDTWAAQNGFRVIRMERRVFLRGPFFLRPNVQNVYQVAIEADGKEQVAWILLNFWHSVRDVVWKDEKE